MNIFVLTGAGVSAESGLGTFRDKDGLWSRFDPMKLATPEAFARDPDQVHAFYNMRRQNLLSAEPNAAHRALARLEAALAERGGSLFLCTQNIDDLHARAGSERVVHIHGELLKARCTACGETMPWRDDLSVEVPCPSCRHSGGLRPHVVWFGEMPLEMDAIYDALLGPTCSLLLAHRARSTRRRASCPRRGGMASAPARSIWSPRITPDSSMRGDMDQQVRSSLAGSSRCSPAAEELRE